MEHSLGAGLRVESCLCSTSPYPSPRPQSYRQVTLLSPV